MWVSLQHEKLEGPVLVNMDRVQYAHEAPDQSGTVLVFDISVPKAILPTPHDLVAGLPGGVVQVRDSLAEIAAKVNAAE